MNPLPPRSGAPGAPGAPGDGHALTTYSLTLHDGARINITGYGDPAARVTAVLLHGWSLDARLWLRQVAALGARPDTRVLAYDARGHGRSSAVRRADATLGRLADDLAEILDATGPHGAVVLAGHSMGGMEIMEYAARYPDEFGARIRGAVLVATTADRPDPERRRSARRAEAAAYRLLAGCGPVRPDRMLLAPPLRTALRRLVFGDPAQPGAVRMTTTMVAGNRLGTIGGFHPALGAHSRLDALAPLTRIPVTVLAGAEDRLTPPACAERIATALPHARHVVFPRAGHMLPLERPDEVTAAITSTIVAVRSGS